MSTPEPIAIVGAGPSGLLLAVYLEQHHIPVVVYEGDPHPHYRPQGGSLDLHEDTGLLALKETNLLQEASVMMRQEGEAMKVADKTGKIWLDENVQEGEEKKFAEGDEVTGRPEIDRTDLRNLLINSLSPSTIQWDHKIISVKAINPSLYQIEFRNKPSITTPYLVGADGAFSLIRPLLHNIKPDYSGISMYDLSISPENLTPELEAFIGKGAMMMLDDGKAFMPQMNSKRSCKVYLALKCSREWQDENPLPESGRKQWLCDLFQEWTPITHEVIMASTEETIYPRRIWQFDPDIKWETDKTGVTVMGDAAHVMSPFAGEGVNQALADALLLGQTLVPIFTSPSTNTSAVAPSPQALHEALRSFEKQMLARAKEEMIGSKENMDIFFGEEAAQHLAEFLANRGQPPLDMH
ncbi:uncharacterized protein IL334_003175 [Kwoniella shivajii]|uniref:FAD-binding domain-containing protein n=1 Tax=Kwoniella shivajii TaxID=564305 RepID=A0ABZ1D0Y3_9TREE|nr:hypothetical protein IL334_003175 [Kwoniella shivajii]